MLENSPDVKNSCPRELPNVRELDPYHQMQFSAIPSTSTIRRIQASYIHILIFIFCIQLQEEVLIGEQMTINSWTFQKLLQYLFDISNVVSFLIRT